MKGNRDHMNNRFKTIMEKTTVRAYLSYRELMEYGLTAGEPGTKLEPLNVGDSYVA